MERDFLKQSIRRELDYYRDGLFNEDGDEEWVRAWSAPDDDDSMAENGYHEPDYDSYIDIGAAFVNDMSTGFLQTEGSEEDWEQLIDSIADILGKNLSRD